MATIPTTAADQYTRVRSYLNPFIKGGTTDAILAALAQNAILLVNSAGAVNDQLYISSASDTYLDDALAKYGIVRPASVGLSDDVFRQIGIQVKNRKQVRDLINQLLDIIFGDEYVKALNSARALEPYALEDGDTLIVNFDDLNTITIPFTSNQFENISAASAQEVADAITKTISSQGFTGSAISQNDGNGNYVQLVSNTIGPASSITVVGGSAETVLKFDSPIAAGGNMSTQWTLTLQPGGVIRFTWSGGANPQVGQVEAGDYVNVFGGGFASSSNEGTFTITTAIGGAVGTAYFEVSNPLGSSGTIVQGTDDAVLFYNPVRKTLSSVLSYAAVYQTQSRTLQIFLPAATKVVRRERQGSAHLHYPPAGTFTFNENPVDGDVFGITTTTSFTAGTDFQIGDTVLETVTNLAAVINGISGLVAFVNSDNIASLQSDDLNLTLTITYTGSQTIVASGMLGDNTSLVPNQPGPYMYDLTQPFTVSNVNTVLTQDLDGTMSRVITVEDSTGFPDTQGYLIFDYGYATQEGPVPYIASPSGTTILISPAYTIQNSHSEGSSVFLVAQKSPVSLAQDGSDYEFFLTDVTSGRTYAQDLITSIAATGINIVFTVLLPSDIGLGKFGTIYTENPTIWS